MNTNNKSMKRVCDHIQKSATSKTDGQKYAFRYISEQQLPKDYFKLVNKHPIKLNDEEKKRNRKWKNKDYICPKYNKKNEELS